MIRIRQRGKAVSPLSMNQAHKETRAGRRQSPPTRPVSMRLKLKRGSVPTPETGRERRADQNRREDQNAKR